MALTHIGIDIGRCRIRAVAVRIVGRDVQVVGHAAIARAGDDGEPLPLARSIAELDALLPLTGEVMVADAANQVLTRVIATPPMSPDRLQRLLRLELAQIHDGKDMASDAVALPVPGDDNHHLAIIAQSAEIRLLLNSLSSAGVAPAAVGHVPIALPNTCLVTPPQGDDPRPFLIVDMGSTSTDVILVGPGGFLCSRSLPIGGSQFTEALALAKGIATTQAEQAKIDGKFAAAAPLPVIAGAKLDEADPFAAMLDEGLGDDVVVPSPGAATMAVANQHLGPELTRVAETMYGQLAATMAWFRTQLKLPKIELSKVLLCGGGAGLAALDEYLARRFNLPVERWDPFAGMTGAKPERPWESAGALGLALSTYPGANRIDLRPEGLLRREAWRTRLMWPFVAAAGFALAGVITAWTIHQHQESERQNAAAASRIVAEHTRLTKALADEVKARSEHTEDLRAVASRIWSGRDLLCTIAAMKSLCEKHQQLWVTELKTIGVGKPEKPGVAPAATSKLPGGKSAAIKDTAVERGAVSLTGQVKFENDKKDSELEEFRDAWQRAIAEWKLPDGSALFKDDKVTFFKLQHEDKTKNDKKAGSFTFTMEFYFADTRIATEEAPTPMPEAASK